MDIKPIRTEEDYRATLREIESLMTAEPGTPEGERLDELVTLVEAYERKLRSCLRVLVNPSPVYRSRSS
jgi:HTH-type transcriptional regulator / antitoxin HigA